MFYLLNERYPSPESGIRSVLTSLLFGLFIGSFLLYFRPFDLKNPKYTVEIVAFFGVIATFSDLFFTTVLTAIFPRLFAEKHWAVKHQILFYLLILLTIASLNGLYINYINDFPFRWGNYWWIINRTFILGFIPISFIVLVQYNRKLRTHLKQAQSLEPYIEQQAIDRVPLTFTIVTALKEEISIPSHSFLFAQSDGNYVHLHLEGKTATMHRLSLQSLESQFEDRSLIRCHRSYLVNLKKIRLVKGNAQGLKVWVGSLEDPIPVSRKYVPTIKAYFQQNPLVN